MRLSIQFVPNPIALHNPQNGRGGNTLDSSQPAGPAVHLPGSSARRHCAAIVRRHARTFWLASALLPQEKRRAAYALYAFCRLADDMVDEPAQDACRQLGEHRARLGRALGGQPETAVFAELAWVFGHFHLTVEPLHELLDGVAIDLETTSYPRWEDVERYCEGVASSVGEMCVRVFGVRGGNAEAARAVSHARALGIAMQWTNVLRDVGEDARRGRCYLPEEELARYGLGSGEVLSGRLAASDARWPPFMRAQVARAREWYARARPGIALLAPDAIGCALACATGYEAILGEIERQGHDTLGRRASLGWASRARVLASAWSAGRRRDGHQASLAGTMG